MQETQHTQQTATRTAQNQDKKKQECKWLQKHRGHTETNKHLLRERWDLLALIELHRWILVS